MRFDEKPYRRTVGIALFDAQGRVFVGKAMSKGPEIVTPGKEWQMPQGAMDAGESVVETARRELREETGVTSAELLDVTSEWWAYDFPPYDGPPHRLTAYRGQQLRWVAFRLTGELGEIDISGLGEEPEFDAWEFVPLGETPARVVAHKREMYEKVVQAFSVHARPA